MTVFFYIPVNDDTSERFLHELETSVPKKDRKIFQSLDEFSCRLVLSSDNRRIAVLLLPSRQDLLSLFTIYDLLLDIRLILILPDRQADTIGMAHALHPRFLSYTDNNFKDVSAVLKRMRNFLKLTNKDL